MPVFKALEELRFNVPGHTASGRQSEHVNPVCLECFPLYKIALGVRPTVKTPKIRETPEIEIGFSRNTR